jgi:cobalt-zinc-cadmium efflux system outer membrane protein
VREQADLLVCDLAKHPIDVAPLAPADATPRKAPAAIPAQATHPDVAPAEMIDAQIQPAQAQVPSLQLPDDNSAGQQPSRRGSTAPRRPYEPYVERFLQTVPPDLRPRPAFKPPLPPVNPSAEERAAYQKQMRELVAKEFAPLPALGPGPQPAPGPEGRALTLADLQRLGMTNSPLLRQAAADVAAARGAVIQAGAYPNPNFGYQSDTAGTAATAGFQGIFIEQAIKTGGKLKLAQAVAQMDLQNAELALRRAQTDLTALIRGGYFAVLVAEENLRIAQFLVDITTVLYDISLRLLEQGIGTYYDAQQMRVLLLQAHGIWIQARNRYTSSWKQLAAALGLPGMPPTQLEGRATLPVMKFNYDTAITRVLNGNTDVLTAQNTVQRARYNLRLAQVTPVPDLMLHLAIEKDYSMPPFATTHSVQLGGPLPVWDQNKGNIIQAQGSLLRAVEETHRVRDDLTTRLADAFERYENNRALLSYYVQYMLSDEVSAFIRSAASSGIDSPLDIRGGISSIVANDQLLVTIFTGYTAALAAQWTAVVDIASLLQTNDLFDILDEQCVGAVPDLRRLPPLPCCHPCSPVQDPSLRGADPSWPPALPALLDNSIPVLKSPLPLTDSTGNAAPSPPTSRK